MTPGAPHDTLVEMLLPYVGHGGGGGLGGDSGGEGGGGPSTAAAQRRKTFGSVHLAVSRLARLPDVIPPHTTSGNQPRPFSVHSLLEAPEIIARLPEPASTTCQKEKPPGNAAGVGKRENTVMLKQERLVAR